MKNSVSYKVLDAAAATGAGKKIYAEDYRHAVLTFDTAGSGNLTVKVQGSMQDGDDGADYDPSPDFDAAQSPTNQWDYMELIDLEDGSAIDGDTGIAVAGTDDNRQFAINLDGINWLTANVTARSAGNVTCKIKLFNNA